jgi:hypothetical protein
MLAIITVLYGPTTPDGLVFKRRLLSLGNGADAVAAFAEQDGVEWIELVSVEPVDPETPYVDLDPVAVSS